MPDLHLLSLKDLQRAVDQHYRVYLKGEGHSVVQDVLRKWTSAGWEPIVFGGVLRDLVLDGDEAKPKDIDVVIRNRMMPDLRAELAPYIVRETRFGGLQTMIRGIRFDIWPLYRTWAFKNSSLKASIANLVKTTFLNIEAIAAIPSVDGGTLTVTENGFVSAVNQRRLDINFWDNPYPSLAATRSLIMARRLRFTMSPDLVKYIVEVIRSRGIETLVTAQSEHYGRVQMQSSEIEKYLEYSFGVRVGKPSVKVYLKH